jgi:hypothetical protein
MLSIAHLWSGPRSAGRLGRCFLARTSCWQAVRVCHHSTRSSIAQDHLWGGPRSAAPSSWTTARATAYAALKGCMTASPSQATFTPSLFVLEVNVLSQFLRLFFRAPFLFLQLTERPQ